MDEARWLDKAGLCRTWRGYAVLVEVRPLRCIQHNPRHSLTAPSSATAVCGPPVPLNAITVDGSPAPLNAAAVDDSPVPPAHPKMDTSLFLTVS